MAITKGNFKSLAAFGLFLFVVFSFVQAHAQTPTPTPEPTPVPELTRTCSQEYKRVVSGSPLSYTLRAWAKRDDNGGVSYAIPKGFLLKVFTTVRNVGKTPQTVRLELTDFIMGFTMVNRTHFKDNPPYPSWTNTRPGTGAKSFNLSETMRAINTTYSEFTVQPGYTVKRTLGFQCVVSENFNNCKPIGLAGVGFLTANTPVMALGGSFGETSVVSQTLGTYAFATTVCVKESLGAIQSSMTVEIEQPLAIHTTDHPNTTIEESTSGVDSYLFNSDRPF